MVAMCLSLGAVVSGIFGMNLDNGHIDSSDSHAWFIGVVTALSLVCIVWGFGTFWYFNKKGVWVS